MAQQVQGREVASLAPATVTVSARERPEAEAEESGGAEEREGLQESTGASHESRLAREASVRLQERQAATHASARRGDAARSERALLLSQSVCVCPNK